MTATSKSERTRLPVIGFEPRGSLAKDGHRIAPQPADVRGRFTRVRRIGFAALVAIAAVLPWIPVGAHPAVFLDVPDRRFYLFGQTFNAQDFWLVFFLITGGAFSLIVLTTLAGRVWCGFACPQTVLLEGVFRRIERWIEGSREKRLRRNAGPVNGDWLWRKILKHVVFVVTAFAIAHGVLAYFASVPGTFAMMQRSPAEHPEAFVWTFGVSAALYVNFAFFREQLCLIVCPYGRLQSVLTDQDSLVVGYDGTRGEPRGKAKAKASGADGTAVGDCVDCRRCVVVCPTGIDIRDGQQIDCVGCTACIDACDEVMDKLGRPRGLVRYDSLRSLAGGRRKIWRPRLAFYAVLLAAGVIAAGLAFRTSSGFEANLLRLPGEPYIIEDGHVRNSFQVHVVNKRSEPAVVEIEAQADRGTEVIIATPRVRLGPLEGRRLPVIVVRGLHAENGGGPAGAPRSVSLVVRMTGQPAKTLAVPFLAPEGA